MNPPASLRPATRARLPRVLYQMMRADVLERTRRYSFLITLGLMIFLAFSYAPSRESGFITLSVDGARGLYNSA
jgi:hypothetical protein